MEIEIALMAAVLSMSVSLVALISSASNLLIQRKTRDVFYRVFEEAVSIDPDVNHAVRHSRVSSRRGKTVLDKEDIRAVRRALESAMEKMSEEERDLVKDKLGSMNEISLSRYLRALSYKLSGNRSAIGLFVRRIFKGSILTKSS